jgi:hypothetical protein
MHWHTVRATTKFAEVLFVRAPLKVEMALAYDANQPLDSSVDDEGSRLLGLEFLLPKQHNYM